MNPSTPATNRTGLSAGTALVTPGLNTGQGENTRTPATNQSSPESFSLDPTKIKEARERVKSHLTDEATWNTIESQPAPVRDLLIWFCDQMNLAHSGTQQRERALAKFVDVKEDDFYKSRSINIKVSLNCSQAIEGTKDAEAEILGFAHTLDTFQRCASQHMHNMAKLELGAAKKNVVTKGTGLTLQLFWRIIDYTSSTEGPSATRSLQVLARQFTKLYLTSLEASKQFCTGYLNSTITEVHAILDRLAPPGTTAESRNNYNTGTETILFQKVTGVLDTVYLQVSSDHQKMLNANRTKRRAEAAFNARYKSRQIENATAATAKALNGEKTESMSTMQNLVQGEMKSSGPKIVGTILKQAARKKSSGGTNDNAKFEADPQNKTRGMGSKRRKQEENSGDKPEKKSKQRPNPNQKKQQRAPKTQTKPHQSQPSGGRGGKHNGNAPRNGSNYKGKKARK
jgi:hypothetical protein